MQFVRIDSIDDELSRAAFSSLHRPVDDFSLQQPVFTTFKLNKAVYHAIFAPFPQQSHWPWVVGIYVPEDDYLGVIKSNQRFNIYLALAISFLASWVGYLIARSIVRPVSELAKCAQTLIEEQGNVKVDITSRFIEIQDTADAFRRMVVGLEEQEKKNLELNESLRQTSIATVMRLSMAAEYKDKETAAHIERMSQLGELIARELGMEPWEIEVFRYAVAMHDIGKIAIPNAILLKPAKLNANEWQIIKTHPEKGAYLLKDPETELLEMARVIALTHHEKWDGSGYPHGLHGAEIPLVGRVCAVADVFDALLSRRSYKDPYDFQQSVDMIYQESGYHFDPKVVAAFFAVLAEIMDIYNPFQNQLA